MHPTVTISIEEYDGLRKIKDSIESGEVYLRYTTYSGGYVTNDKTSWIIGLVNDCRNLSEENTRLRNDIDQLRKELGMPRRRLRLFS